MGAYGRAESSTVFAPDVEPLVMSHEYVHRSPVLVVATDGARIEVDLEGLSADTALSFIDRLRSTLDMYATQWKEWEARAAMDRTGPYPVPPLFYGFAGDGPGVEGAAGTAGVPEESRGSPRSRRRRSRRGGDVSGPASGPASGPVSGSESGA